MRGPIITAAEAADGTTVFGLHGQGFTYAMRVTPEGLLQHLHFGPPLDAGALRPGHVRTHRDVASWHEATRDLSLNDLPQEYPVPGLSDYRHAAVAARGYDGHLAGALLYRGHEVVDGKPGLNGLPGADGEGASTLLIDLEEPRAGLAVRLAYTVWPDEGVIARSARIVNEGGAPVTLERALSASLDLPDGSYEAIHLHGSWAREFGVERTPLPAAKLVIDSVRGASSAAHSPFLALAEPGTTEEAGRVFAATLVYSGNHAFTAERGEFGDVRLSAGINPEGFAWRLEPGEAFQTPEALLVTTVRGLGGMSQAWHGFVRRRIVPGRWRDAPRPTYLNTWEAAYFAVDEDKVLGLAGRAAALGAEMLVLDDGWFEGRVHDRTSLGIWKADPERFPSGIPALAAKVRAKGLKFGLWFEPEMINPDSPLLAEHPGWTLHVPGREASLARGQLTLDLSRAEVCDQLYDQIATLLGCGDIAYVKWDMNRPMTDIGSAALPPERQAEVPHRYMLGLYGLLSRLTADFPDVLFEACASGGNRFDLGMLRFMPQGWVSDMCDPVGRAAILSGASLLYPPSVMAAYIGPSPNHQNGRVTSVEARYNAGALCAAQGLSLSEADLDAHGPELAGRVAEMKARAPSLLSGRFDRLLTGGNEVCWQHTTEDGARVDVMDLHILSGPNQPFRRVRLRGLDPDAVYVLGADGSRHEGQALMSHGLPLPPMAMMWTGETAYLPRGDFVSALLVLRRED